jgi:hypothetical protein
MVNPFFFQNGVLNLLSGVVALLVSYSALKYGRLAASGFLRMLGTGFMVLGMGLVSQAIVFFVFELNLGSIQDRVQLTYEATEFYMVLQVLAYLLIVLGYSRRLHGPGSLALRTEAAIAPAVIVTPLLLETRFFQFAELVIVVLNLIIVFQALFVLLEGGNRLSLLVLGAFSMILAAHLVAFLAALLLSGVLYLTGDGVQLAGFVTLLTFLIRSGKVGRA